MPIDPPLPIDDTADRVRVLFVIGDLDTGGAERMLVKIATHLSPRIAAQVVSLKPGGALARELEGAGIEVASPAMTGAASTPRALHWLVRHLRETRPDVVSTWMYHADLIGGLAARLAGIDAVAWNIRNSDLSRASSSRSTRMVVRANALLSRRLPRRILCCSERAMQIHVAIGYDPARFELLPNGFDLSLFRPDPRARAAVRAEFDVADDAPLIGLVARWHAQKNHRGFVLAAAKLLRTHPDARFLLVGDQCDTHNPVLQQWLREAGVTETFRLAGRRDDIARMTAAFDIATSASISGEAFPNVLGEAMACAVPCVATDVGDSAAIVGGTGRIVAPDDVDALADAWSSFLRLGPGERAALGESARRRVSENFELQAVADRYERAFIALTRPVGRT